VPRVDVPDPVEEPEALEAAGVALVDVVFAAGSGVNGLRVGPPRCWAAPLVISATAFLAFAGA